MEVLLWIEVGRCHTLVAVTVVFALLPGRTGCCHLTLRITVCSLLCGWPQGPACSGVSFLLRPDKPRRSGWPASVTGPPCDVQGTSLLPVYRKRSMPCITSVPISPSPKSTPSKKLTPLDVQPNVTAGLPIARKSYLGCDALGVDGG